MTLARYRDELAEILRLVIRHGKGVEVNTKNWSPAVARDYADLLALYRDLGGEVVTVGSDAHAPDAVAAHIPEAYRLLREAGWRCVAVFRARAPHFISLEGN